MMYINVDLLQWFIIFFIKRLLPVVLLKMKLCEFKKRKVDSSFIDNISSADLAYMQLTSKFGKGF